MSLTDNALDVIKFILGNKNVFSYHGVPIAEGMGLKGGHLSTIFLCTSQRPYKTLGHFPTALIFSWWSILQVPDYFKDFCNIS